MWPCFRFVVFAAALGALAGCAGALDVGQARLCRAVVPALNAPGALIEGVRTIPLAAGDGVRVDYRLAAGTAPRGRFVECRFAPGNKLVFFADPRDWTGRLARVTIAQTGPWSLQGNVAGEGVPA